MSSYNPYVHQASKKKKLQGKEVTLPVQTKIDDQREKLILDNMDLVSNITGKYCKKFGNFVSRDELYSAISCALVQSAIKFDFSLGKCFRKFASARLHGSVIDHIRSLKHWGKQHSKKESPLKNIGYIDDDFDFPAKENNDSLFDTESFFAEIKNILNEDEYAIVHEIMFSGISAKQLAKKRGDNYSTIDFRYRVAKEKIKVFFSELEYDERSQWAPLFWKYDIQEEIKTENEWQRNLRNTAINSMRNSRKERN